MHPRPTGSWAIALLACLLLAPACPAGARSSVVINKHSPNVTERRFDPAHPPAEMPPLTGNEAAVTAYNLSCSVRTAYEISDIRPSGDAYTAVGRIQQVTVDLGLQIVIWLPQHANDQLIQHEYGHRAIAQRMYERADAIARAAADHLIGRTFQGTGPTRDAATHAPGQLAGEELTRAYTSQLTDPTSRIQARYDDLTEHGRKPTPTSQQAADQVLAEAQKPRPAAP
jgi:hypothetical protein